MGKVSAFAQDGFELFFNSSDHLAPHFHAERSGEWEVRVFFLQDDASMVEIKWSLKAPSKRELKRLCAAAAQFRPQLLAEWEQKVIVTAPGAKE